MKNIIIFSADIVDYTNLSHNIDNAALLKTINKIFSFLDLHVMILGGEKVNILGDCYQFIMKTNSVNKKEHINSVLKIGKKLIKYLSHMELDIKMRIGIDHVIIPDEVEDISTIIIDDSIEQNCIIGDINMSERAISVI